MTDDRGNRMLDETPLPQDTEPPQGSLSSILDAFDMDGVGEIDIVFERPPNHPRPAAFD